MIRPRKPSPDASELDHLLRDVGAGDIKAFGTLYERTSPVLFSICLRILPIRTQAEDTLQDVFMTVWRQAATYDPDRGRAMTWLMTLSRNRSIDRLRADRVLQRVVENDAALRPQTQIGADDELEEDEERRRLQDCLGQLEASSRVLIITSFFEGVSYPQLAGRASLPLSTVKSRIRRALHKLRECLE